MHPRGPPAEPVPQLPQQLALRGCAAICQIASEARNFCLLTLPLHPKIWRLRIHPLRVCSRDSGGAPTSPPCRATSRWPGVHSLQDVFLLPPHPILLHLPGPPGIRHLEPVLCDKGRPGLVASGDALLFLMLRWLDRAPGALTEVTHEPERASGLP